MLNENLAQAKTPCSERYNGWNLQKYKKQHAYKKIMEEWKMDEIKKARTEGKYERMK